MKKTCRIAAIPGDGIGKEVLPEGIRVLQAAAQRWDLSLSFEQMEWASCEYYAHHGKMMPDDWREQLQGFDAIYFGAVGWPDTVPDHISLWGSLLKFRREFDQYVNLRPVRLFPGVPCPLAGKKAGDIDFYVVRENTEGEYAGAGGRVHVGTPNEVAVETAVFTRTGVERILRFAVEQAMKRRKKLASVTKSNAQKYSMVFWDEITDLLAREYPEVEVSHYHIDAICTRMVMAPESLDVVVASNLFGDILTDLGAAIQGGLGFASSANINPDRDFPSMFEPVHGSAPDIAHLGIANPMAAIWSAAQMLDHLNESAAAARILTAMEAVTAQGIGTTPGRDRTETITDAVLAALEV